MGESFANSPEEEADLLEHPSSFSSSSSGGQLKFWKTLGIAAVILLVTIGGFYAHSKYEDKLLEAYNQGNYEGQLSYIMYQQKTGQVIYMANISGNMTMRTTTYEEICGRQQG